MHALTIRKLSPEDLPRAMEIAKAAREFQKNTGNPGQWGPGYPSESDLLRDMERESAYAVEGEDGSVHAFFAFIVGEDPTYGQIEASERENPHGETPGCWLSDRPYGTIHRIASDGTVHGVFEKAVAFGFTLTDSIRIDTHWQNGPMRHKCVKNGFVPCGIITIASGDKRIAYQKDR